MADIIVSRPGQINNAGDDRALFLKQFAGEVLVAFKANTVTLDKHIVRTITSGKSAQFPLTGIATAKYMKAGQNILDPAAGLLQQIPSAERTISIDDLLVATTVIYDLDQAMSSYEYRSTYANELGSALALTWDGNVLRKMIQASRMTTAAYTGGPVGVNIKGGATVATTASVLAANIAKAATIMDNAKVPATDRWCYLRPDQYSLLTQYRDVLDQNIGGSGSIAQGKIYQIAGVNLVKTTEIPNGVEAAKDGDKNGYSGDYSATVALVAHRGAAGTVKLLDIGIESERKIELQGELTVAKYAVGHGALRPECAVEITSTAP